MCIVMADSFPNGPGIRGLQLLDTVCRFSCSYHRRPVAVLVLTIRSILRRWTSSYPFVCPFNRPFRKCQAVIPPWCFRFPWSACRDSSIDGLVEYGCNIGNCSQCIFFSLQICQVNTSGTDMLTEDFPVCLIPVAPH